MRLLTLRAVCRLLACSRATVLGWVEAGQFPGPVALPDGRRRWRAIEVLAWIESLAPPRPAGRPRVDVASLPELCRDVLQALEEAGPGEWLNGAQVAAKIGGGVSHTDGNFRRAVERLKAEGLIHTDQSRGYALASDEVPALTTDLPAPDAVTAGRGRSRAARGTQSGRTRDADDAD